MSALEIPPVLLPPMLTPRDVASYLRVSRAQAYALVETMPRVRLSSKASGRGNVRVRREDFLTWLEGRAA